MIADRIRPRPPRISGSHRLKPETFCKRRVFSRSFHFIQFLKTSSGSARNVPEQPSRGVPLSAPLRTISVARLGFTARHFAVTPHLLSTQCLPARSPCAARAPGFFSSPFGPACLPGCLPGVISSLDSSPCLQHLPLSPFQNLRGGNTPLGANFSGYIFLNYCLKSLYFRTLSKI